MTKVIGNKVAKQELELDALDKELNVQRKELFTEIKTGRFFFVRHFAKGTVVSDIYEPIAE
jgi:hypothetical protein